MVGFEYSDVLAYMRAGRETGWHHLNTASVVFWRNAYPLAGIDRTLWLRPVA